MNAGYSCCGSGSGQTATTLHISHMQAATPVVDPPVRPVIAGNLCALGGPGGRIGRVTPRYLDPASWANGGQYGSRAANSLVDGMYKALPYRSAYRQAETFPVGRRGSSLRRGHVDPKAVAPGWRATAGSTPR